MLRQFLLVTHRTQVALLLWRAAGEPDDIGLFAFVTKMRSRGTNVSKSFDLMARKSGASGKGSPLRKSLNAVPGRNGVSGSKPVHLISKQSRHGENPNHGKGHGDFERGAEYQADGGADAGAGGLLQIAAGRELADHGTDKRSEYYTGQA